MSTRKPVEWNVTLPGKRPGKFYLVRHDRLNTRRYPNPIGQTVITTYLRTASSLYRYTDREDHPLAQTWEIITLTPGRGVECEYRPSAVIPRPDNSPFILPGSALFSVRFNKKLGPESVTIRYGNTPGWSKITAVKSRDDLEKTRAMPQLMYRRAWSFLAEVSRHGHALPDHNHGRWSHLVQDYVRAGDKGWVARDHAAVKYMLALAGYVRKSHKFGG